MSLARLAAIAAVVPLAACASGSGGGSLTPSRSVVLTADEIATHNIEGSSAYDAVVRLRPKWLRARGVKSLQIESDSSEYAYIFVDGRPLGRFGTLKDIPLYQVSDIRFYDVAEAAQFGPRGEQAGVIEVRLKKPEHQ